MNKEKVLLIAGCSHAAGAEIDGSMDSRSNRQQSFGNLLARMIGYRAINIAAPGSTNPTIARSIQEWMASEYKKDTMDLLVLVAWTENFRMEVVAPTGSSYHNEYPDWKSPSADLFLRITPHYMSSRPEEKAIISACNKLITYSPTYVDIISAILVLQMQSLFKAEGVKYIMCDSMETFSDDIGVQQYTNLIDQTYYMNMNDRNSAFYWKYEQQGFKNPKAKYFHHNEEPHILYAKELFLFGKQRNLF